MANWEEYKLGMQEGRRVLRAQLLSRLNVLNARWELNDVSYDERLDDVITAIEEAK